MGTCCARCLPAKVRDYARNAENGAVTVTVIENSGHSGMCGHKIGNTAIDHSVFCTEPAKFAVSFFPKK